MNRIDRIKLAIEKGYKYNPVTGDIIGPNGDLITSRNKKGYLRINLTHQNKQYHLFAHHFAYYIHNGLCPYKVDHINRDKSNKVENLREGDNMIDGRNRTHKGYTKVGNKFRVRVRIGESVMYDKRFKTKAEARSAYLEAKKKYHPEYNV